MALIKPDNSITDIRGTLGGSIFKRDASGLHVTAKNHTVRYARSPNQKRMVKWYAGKKRTEYKEGEPTPEIETPETPYSAVVYSVEYIWGYQQPTFITPPRVDIIYTGSIWDQIELWVDSIWAPAFDKSGFTKQTVAIVTFLRYLIYYETRRWSSQVALTAAKTNTLLYIMQVVNTPGVLAVGMIVGLLALAVVFKVLDWLDGSPYNLSYSKGPVLLRKKNSLWWGSLVERPSRKMFIFTDCRPVKFFSYNWWVPHSDTDYKIHYLYPGEIWETVKYFFPAWRIITFDTIRCRYRGRAYSVGPGSWQLECEPSQQNYWQKPIGWSRDWATACGFVNDFDNWS